MLWGELVSSRADPHTEALNPMIFPIENQLCENGSHFLLQFKRVGWVKLERCHNLTEKIVTKGTCAILSFFQRSLKRLECKENSEQPKYIQERL